MIADKEPNGLFRNHRKLDDYGSPVCAGGPPRPVFLRLEAVGSARVAALPLLASGPLHFIRTALLASITPPFFPYRPQLVLFTGVLELAGAIGLLLPRFTRLASACLAVLMIAIFPANVYGANQTVGGLHLPSVPVRLAMQVLYIVLLLVAGWGIPRTQKA